MILVTGGQYFDQPWIAAGAGQAPSERNVYVVWASNGHEGGDSVSMSRSIDGGDSFEPARTILDAHRPTTQSATPKIVAGAHGLVCAVPARGRWTSTQPWWRADKSTIPGRARRMSIRGALDPVRQLRSVGTEGAREARRTIVRGRLTQAHGGHRRQQDRRDRLGGDRDQDRGAVAVLHESE